MRTPARSQVHGTLSTLMVVLGLVLMIGKVYADSEPGAIPLLLIVLGAGWRFVARLRARPRHD